MLTFKEVKEVISRSADIYLDYVYSCRVGTIIQLDNEFYDQCIVEYIGLEDGKIIVDLTKPKKTKNRKGSFN